MRQAARLAASGDVGTDGPRQYQQFGDSNEALLAPAGQAMLDAAQLRPGERVLDVGFGSGTPTLEAADRAARSGRVVGVDISAAMLQPARQRIAAAGVDNVELNFAPYAGQQGVMMDATAWLVTAHR